MPTAHDRLPPGPLTYEDYCELPEDGNRWEILDGEIYVSPAPWTRHQRVAFRLAMVVATHVDERGLGEVFDTPIDLILDTTTVAQPDFLFVATGHEAIVTERAIEGPPDLVVEVLSPSTAKKDRTTKARLYARFGIPGYWIVDPEARTLEQWILEGAEYRLEATVAGDATFRPALFPELAVPLGRIWA